MNRGLFADDYKCISVDFLEEDEYLLNYGLYSRHGSKLKVLGGHKQLTHLSQMEDKFIESDIVLLNLSGKGIIIKSIEETSFNIHADTNKLTELFLPNSDSQDFVINFFEAKNKIYAAICRKSLLDKILFELSKIQCNPVFVYLGPFNIEYVLPYVNNESELNLNSNSVQINQGEIIGFSKDTNFDEQTIFQIDEYGLDTNSLLLLATVMKFINEAENHPVQHPNLEDNRRTIFFKKKFNNYLLYSAAALFLLLLLNFFTYRFFASISPELDAENMTLANLKETSNQQRLKFIAYKTFVESKGWNNSTFLAEYVEKILAGTSNGLNINTFDYQLKRKSNSQVKMPQYHSIFISGVVENSNQLNRWMKNVSALGIFKDVKLTSYVKNTNANDYAFDLEITLK